MPSTDPPTWLEAPPDPEPPGPDHICGPDTCGANFDYDRGLAEGRAAERERWASAVQIQIRTLRTSVSQEHQFAASVLQDLLDLVGPLAKVADALSEMSDTRS